MRTGQRARCWRWRPGLARPARMRSMRNGRPVTTLSASADRRICPPPSPWDPSRWMSSDMGWKCRQGFDSMALNASRMRCRSIGDGVCHRPWLVAGGEKGNCDDKGDETDTCSTPELPRHLGAGGGTRTRDHVVISDVVPSAFVTKGRSATRSRETPQCSTPELRGRFPRSGRIRTGVR